MILEMREQCERCLRATDPVTFVGVAVLLGVTALAANLVPALCATRVDPAVVLREE
jgi:ABC-type lipoprotein release transport system permease subunit